jgi:hypothetical protein
MNWLENIEWLYHHLKQGDRCVITTNDPDWKRLVFEQITGERLILKRLFFTSNLYKATLK